jgi:hypothetical protein
MRSIITTSQAAMPRAMSVQRVQPANSSASGISSGGATMRRSPAPRVRKAWYAERATREWRISPTMAMERPSQRPLRCRTVNASSRPCVGCDTCASPADSTLTCGATLAATIAGTPTSASRSTNTFTCSDSSVKMVSSMLSPFTREESCTSRFTTSAPRRLAASSNETRVRVEGSVNMLATVTPASTSVRGAIAPGWRA